MKVTQKNWHLIGLFLYCFTSNRFERFTEYAIYFHEFIAIEKEVFTFHHLKPRISNQQSRHQNVGIVCVYYYYYFKFKQALT